jgi:hypothetical protein
MRIASPIYLLCVSIVFTADIATAQIYESRDADGNVVFSDTPIAGSKPVNLEKTNTSMPVAERPQANSAPDAGPAVTSSSSAEQRAPATAAGSTLKGGWRQPDSGQRREVRDAESRHEVRDAESRHQVQGASPRDEVEDAGRRREKLDTEQRGEVSAADPRHRVQDVDR